jgi:DNA invertase Pin-like site-specific DNA recombinase
MSPRKKHPARLAVADGPAVGYLRVSTNEQADNGDGLEVQRDAIIVAAAEDGRTIGAWYTDAAESGGDGLDVRVELAAALDATGPAGTLYIYRLDRLARDLILQEQLLADVWRRGGNVRSASTSENHYLDPDDRTDPSRTLIRQVLGAVAEYERKMIALRMQSGRRRKIRTTGYAGGPRPYGWESDAGTLVPVPVEQGVLRYIADAVAYGTPYRRIADDMNARGIPKLTGTGPWLANEVHRTLARAMARWAGPIPVEYRADMPEPEGAML